LKNPPPALEILSWLSEEATYEPVNGNRYGCPKEEMNKYTFTKFLTRKANYAYGILHLKRFPTLRPQTTSSNPITGLDAHHTTKPTPPTNSVPEVPPRIPDC
jgi:hypothetical protein